VSLDPRAAEVLQAEMWRQLQLEERPRIVFAMIAASIHAAHLEYSPEEFEAILRKRISGD